MANAGTQSIIKHMIKEHRVSILAIIEPMIKPKPEYFSRRFGLQYKGCNENEQIWIFVENGVEVDEWDISEQVLHGRFSTLEHPTPFHLSIVYGKCSRAGRLPLWDKLREIAARMEGVPWLVGGDFNTFVSEEERQGSNLNRIGEMMDFADVINECQLLDLGADGSKFTWSIGETFERLDRALIGEG
ncbi:uncharacterized protein LOC121754537 [Salvia splendens]|uniref:uncharacterized protein LOC121754537 n=1 Tax=Salvia splendens TaxID=180675 RepID=UPI001C267BDF|nr:uncharacterized protein LOC121754537 [Salvia splendens]